MELMRRLKQAHKDWTREDAYWAEIEANHDQYATPDPNALRLYVLVRDDILPPIQQGIQAAHAIVEFINATPPSPKRIDDYNVLARWMIKDKTLILLSNDEGISETAHCLQGAYDVRYAEFREPDLDNIVTAIAFEPMTKGRGEIIFNGMRLAR